jgi:hypothetical protein
VANTTSLFNCAPFKTLHKFKSNPLHWQVRLLRRLLVSCACVCLGVRVCACLGVCVCACVVGLELGGMSLPVSATCDCASV